MRILRVAFLPATMPVPRLTGVPRFQSHFAWGIFAMVSRCASKRCGTVADLVSENHDSLCGQTVLDSLSIERTTRRLTRVPLAPAHARANAPAVARGLLSCLSEATDGVPEIGQGADHAIIPPGTILMRHAHHQVLHFLVDRGASRRLALLRAVTLLGHELPVSAKHHVGLDDLGNVLEGWLPQLLADVGQRLAFAIRQAHTARDLVAQDAILRHQVWSRTK